MHKCLCNNLYMSHGHGVDLDHVDAETAQSVAQTMQALAAPSRVLILSRLGAGPCSVSDLAVEIGMSQPAVSQQLRVLRYLDIVVGTREGRHVVYELHDDHVRALLTEAVSHVEHLRLGTAARAGTGVRAGGARDGRQVVA
jgi:DNA-binding transcriptional ArsR family regulator